MKHSSLLENIGSLGYADLPNVGSFHDTISKKISFVIITTNLIGKFLKDQEAVKLMVARNKFSKIQIFG